MWRAHRRACALPLPCFPTLEGRITAGSAEEAFMNEQPPANEEQPARSRRFRLVDLLVLLGMLVVVVGLFVLPYLQRARAASNVTICQNNLKQIGDAIGHSASYDGMTPLLRFIGPPDL